MRAGLIRFAILGIFAILMTTNFQNCGMPGKFANAASGNGTGYEGMYGGGGMAGTGAEGLPTYTNGTCADGTAANVLVLNGNPGFELIRQNCQPLAPGRPIPESEITEIGNAVVYQGLTYQLQ